MVTITISDTLYQQAQRVARLTAQPVEQVIQAHLATALSETDALPPLPTDARDETEAMRLLSDDPLWTLAREQMPKPLDDRMQVLMTRNNFGTITDDERAELKDYVERGNRLMLRKATAMKLLTERGYTVTYDSLAPVGE